MTEYTATCDYRAADKIRAVNDGEGKVAVRAYEGGSFRVAYLLRPADARAFARGILALADEIDGGEAPEPVPARKVKVDDKLRVTKDGLHDAEVSVGDVLTVEHAYDNGDHFYTEGDGWVFYARHIGNGLEFVDETAPAPADELLKIGDRVVVHDAGEEWTRYIGRVGELRQIDSDSVPYFVQFDDGDALYVIRVCKVDEPATAPSVASPRRLAALKEATALLGYDAPDPDAVTLARFLLGE